MHLNASSASGTPSGWSVGELGSLFNSRFNLTGLVTPGAAVVGVSYENLLLSARPPSFGSEACMAFSTDSRYAGVICPSTLDAPGSQVRENPIACLQARLRSLNIFHESPLSVVITWRRGGMNVFARH